MRRCCIATRAQLGIDAPEVTVETHLQAGTPGFVLVGLPENALRESRTRVKSAIQNCGFAYPSQRVVVNLAPADLAKEGARYDLAIALGVLAATGQLDDRRLDRYEFLGELGLFGELRSVRGALCAALRANRCGRVPVLPEDDAAQAAQLGLEVLAVSHLKEAVALIHEEQHKPVHGHRPQPPTPAPPMYPQIIGQAAAKRALLVAAAGSHHMLMIGPPGTGKTMLAQSLTDLLPPLSASESIEVAAIHSAAAAPVTQVRPFRAPHHSATAPAITGGGPEGRPGEISLAHFGTLFLDELPHFKPSVLDHLREPLQAGEIHLSRARYRLRFPARFQLVAAMNPCPQGRTCQAMSCRCSPNERDRYQRRISDPLLDRIDLHVRVPELPPDALKQPLSPNDELEELKAAVCRARQVQQDRQGGSNSWLPGTHPALSTSAASLTLLQRAIDAQRLSARSYHKMLRVARTIADLAGEVEIAPVHLTEALSYRQVNWEEGA